MPKRTNITSRVNSRNRALGKNKPQGLFKLMSGIRELELARGDGEIKVTESEKKVRKHLRG